MQSESPQLFNAGKSISRILATKAQKSAGFRGFSLGLNPTACLLSDWLKM
jgi:hypothetical protein